MPLSRPVTRIALRPPRGTRYLGNSLFYLALINFTFPAEPLVEVLNATLVPRAQFFNSSLNHTSQTTANSDDLPAYRKDLTFTAFNVSADTTTNAIAGVLNGTHVCSG